MLAKHPSRLQRLLVVSAFLAFTVACDQSPGADAGPDIDAGPGGFDAGPFGFDAGPGDAGPDPADAGGLDASVLVDAGAGMDAGSTGMDAGPPDAGPPDAGAPDAGAPDAGAPDAGAPDAGAPDAGATCSILGDFSTTLSGAPAPSFFQFRADGTWSLATTRAGLATSLQTGTYTFAGTTLTLNESFGCMITQTGTYTVTFDPTCATFSLALVTDACAPRGMAIGGTTFARLP